MTWFDEALSYTGEGQATFSDPPATMRGPASAAVMSNGIVEITLEVIETRSETELRFGDQDVLTPPSMRQGANRIGIGLELNIPETLSVKTDHGTLVGRGELHITSSALSFGVSKPTVLKFQPDWAEFVPREPAKDAHWALPLANCTPRFRHRLSQDPEQLLARHPLRLNGPPGGFDPEEMPDPADKLLVFQEQDGVAFVEPLPDYDRRVAQLQDGEARSLLTAVLVGDVRGRPTQGRDAEEWLPTSLMPMLGFATGVEAGALWFEFRDEKARLARRVHRPFGVFAWERGLVVIEETFHKGMGEFLSRVLQSATAAQDYYFVAVRHLIRAGSLSLSIEDRLAHLCRCLDGLITGMKIEDSIRAGRSLPKGTRKEITRAVQDATKALGALATSLRKRDEPDGGSETVPPSVQADVVETIVRQLENAQGEHLSFGRKVAALTDSIGVKDTPVMRRFFIEHPRGDKRDWPALISKARGATMHAGFIDFKDGGEDIEEIAVLFNHLHDLLARMLLALVGYEGTYQPTVLSWREHWKVNWVTEETSAETFGYVPEEEGESAGTVAPPNGNKEDEVK